MVELYVSREQELYRTGPAMQAARRSTTGWLTPDAAARGIEYDASCAKLLAASPVLEIRPDGDLGIDPWSIYSTTGASGLPDLVRLANQVLLGNWH